MQSSTTTAAAIPAASKEEKLSSEITSSKVDSSRLGAVQFTLKTNYDEIVLATEYPVIETEREEIKSHSKVRWTGPLAGLALLTGIILFFHSLSNKNKISSFPDTEGYVGIGLSAAGLITLLSTLARILFHKPNSSLNHRLLENIGDEFTEDTTTIFDVQSNLTTDSTSTATNTHSLFSSPGSQSSTSQLSDYKPPESPSPTN